MSTKPNLLLSVILTVTLVVAACAPAAASISATTAPTTAPVQLATTQPTTTAVSTTARVQPTATSEAVAAEPVTTTTLSDDDLLKVGLVSDVDGLNDNAFNQLAWAGIQQAAEELGFQAEYIESAQPSDYESNIDALATDGYDVIITVGPSMGDVTALKAREYPDIRFAIVDYAYAPTSGSQACAVTVSNCYADGGLTNVTSLMFAEHQLGFLAGVLGGGMSNSGFVCSVTSVPPPASDRYVLSFRAGATWLVGEDLQGMNNYINIETTNENMPISIDATEGKETAQRLIDAGCDVVFGIAANGALLAAKENNVMAVGYNIDQYNRYPEAKEALLTSTQKNVDVSVYNYLKTVDDGSVLAGTNIGNLQNGGISLAPFHDWDSRIPDELKAQIQAASDGIKNGSITIELP